MYTVLQYSHMLHSCTCNTYSICTLELVELIAPSVEALVVSVSFISSTGKLAGAEVLVCVGRVRSLFAVLEDGFCEVREALLLEVWSTGCVYIKQ